MLTIIAADNEKQCARWMPLLGLRHGVLPVLNLRMKSMTSLPRSRKRLRHQEQCLLHIPLVPHHPAPSHGWLRACPATIMQSMQQQGGNNCHWHCPWDLLLVLIISPHKCALNSFGETLAASRIKVQWMKSKARGTLAHIMQSCKMSIICSTQSVKKVGVYICTYVRMHACMHTRAHTHAHMYARMHAHARTCMHTRTHEHTCTRKHMQVQLICIRITTMLPLLGHTA